MKERTIKLVEQLADGSEISSAQLSKALGIGTRSLQNAVREANDRLLGQAHISHTSRSAYVLIIDNPAKFSQMLREARRPSALPQTHGERVQYLLNDLLLRSNWITIDRLSEVLYVSRRTVSEDISKVERHIQPFNLTIERRPHYGIRISGNEKDRRICLARLISEQPQGLSSLSISPNMLEQISNVVAEALDQTDFNQNVVAYKNLVTHIAIALMRVQQGCSIPLTQEDKANLQRVPEIPVAQAIADGILNHLGIKLPDGEIAYIAVHLAAKYSAFAPSTTAQEIVNGESWQIASELTDAIWNVFRFDFRGDLELKMNLSRHIGPLLVRLENHMELPNPILDTIRSSYPLAWTMAGEAESVIRGHLDCKLPESEIGYIAMILALSLETTYDSGPKKRVLIVCASGASSARLLKHQCEQEFSDCIGSIETCNLLELNSRSLDSIDYVFTTVPLNRSLPVPVRQIDMFFNSSSAGDIRRSLNQTEAYSHLMTLIQPDTFLAHCEAKSKEDVISLLCNAIAQIAQIDGSVLQKLVFEREKLAATAFGDIVAIPHPAQAITESTFAAVALLDHPLKWNEHSDSVRIVFLISPSNDGAQELKPIFDLLAEIFDSKDATDRLLAEQTIETLGRIACELSL